MSPATSVSPIRSSSSLVLPEHTPPGKAFDQLLQTVGGFVDPPEDANVVPSTDNGVAEVNMGLGEIPSNAHIDSADLELTLRSAKTNPWAPSIKKVCFCSTRLIFGFTSFIWKRILRCVVLHLCIE